MLFKNTFLRVYRLAKFTLTLLCQLIKLVKKTLPYHKILGLAKPGQESQKTPTVESSW